MCRSYDFTIITACRNSGRTLRKCLDSVKSQTQVSVQHIIVDSCSTDQTSVILEENSRQELTLIVEKDDGVYEAWNKGVAKIQGAWVLFLGSDDELASPTVLSDLLELIKSKPGFRIFYGKVWKETPDGEFIECNGIPWDELNGALDPPMRKLPPHPACIFHNTLFEDFPHFDENFKLCADSLHLGQILKKEAPIFLPLIVTRFRTGGLTNTRKLAVRKWLEKWMVSQKLGYKMPLSVTFVSLLRAFINQGRA